MATINTLGMVCQSNGYTLTKTAKGWRIEGHEWHSEQDASREFSHHRVRVRDESLSGCLSRFIDRATAIGGRNEYGRNCLAVRGLSRDEAQAVAAELEQKAEAIAEIEAGDESPDVSVAVSDSSNGLQWSIKVKWEGGYSSAYYCTPSIPSRMDLVSAFRREIKCPPVVAAAIDWNSVTVPDATKVLVAKALRTKGELVRISDGARVRVDDSSTYWTPGHPSCGPSIGITTYTIGGQRYSYAEALGAFAPVTHD